MSDDTSNVAVAFELLLEELEAEVRLGDAASMQAFSKGNYDQAKATWEQSRTIIGFRDRVDALRREWLKRPIPEAPEEEKEPAPRRNLGLLAHGVRTPQERYILPILKAVDEAGGAAKASEVVDRVGKIMEPILKPVDYEPLPSSPDVVRWRNTAAWTRWAMIQEGLLKAETPRGVWEISDKGKAELLLAAAREQ